MTYDPTPAGTPEPFTPTTPGPTAVPTNPVVAAPLTAPAATVGVPRKKSGGGLLNAVLVIAAAVALGGVAFAVGRGTAPASAVTGAGRGNQGMIVVPGGSFVPGANGQPGFGGGRGGFGGGLTVSGEVVSIDGDTMTIKTASGQEIEVTTGDSTTYHTQTPATASDVQTGSKVQVQLQLNGTGGAARPGASGVPSGPAGTAGSVTVVP